MFSSPIGFNKSEHRHLDGIEHKARIKVSELFNLVRQRKVLDCSRNLCRQADGVPTDYEKAIFKFSNFIIVRCQRFRANGANAKIGREREKSSLPCSISGFGQTRRQTHGRNGRDLCRRLRGEYVQQFQAESHRFTDNKRQGKNELSANISVYYRR